MFLFLNLKTVTETNIVIEKKTRDVLPDPKYKCFILVSGNLVFDNVLLLLFARKLRQERSAHLPHEALPNRLCNFLGAHKNIFCCFNRTLGGIFFV